MLLFKALLPFSFSLSLSLSPLSLSLSPLSLSLSPLSLSPLLFHSPLFPVWTLRCTTAILQ